MKAIADEADLNDKGEVEIPDDQIIGTATDIFSGKIYGKVEDAIFEYIEAAAAKSSETDEEDASRRTEEAAKREYSRTDHRLRTGTL